MKLARDKYLVEDEFKRLLYAARVRPHVHAKRDLALLATCGGCGLRDVELVGLRIGDLERIGEKPATIRVRTAKKRGVFFEDAAAPPSVVAAVTTYLRSLPPEQKRPQDRLFPLTTRQAARIFKHYAKLAGLSARYSIHALRHFRGVHLYAATKDVNLVKETLRHSSLSSTQVYVHTVDQAEKAAAVDVDFLAEEGEVA